MKKSKKKDQFWIKDPNLSTSKIEMSKEEILKHIEKDVLNVMGVKEATELVIGRK